MPLRRKGQLKGMAKGDVLAQNRVIAQGFGLVVYVVYRWNSLVLQEFLSQYHVA